jgi:clan AA aspartic protease
MITGVVNPRREATIPLTVRDAGGREHAVEGVIDTGFNGSLTLPPALISMLGLTWRSRERALLADGREHRFDLYAVTVVWDGRPRHLLAQAADTEPLVGMSLLYGYHLQIEIVDGGQVTIAAISQTTSP